MDHSSKRARTEDFFDLFSSLCNIIHGIPELVAKHQLSSGSVIEVETRIGMLVEGGRRMYHQVHQPLGCRIFDDLNRGSYSGYEFQPGVDEELVERIRKSLGERCRETRQMQVLYIDQFRNRWEMTDDSKVSSLPEKKSHIYRADLALLGHSYDIRVDVAIESVESDAKKINPEKWILKRIKKRSTFKAEQAYWRVDLTEVQSISNPTTGSSRPESEVKEIELEFELEQPALQLYLSQPENQRAEMTKAIVMELLRLVELCIPSNLNIPSHAKLSPCDGKVLSLILAASQKISSHGFLGAMPVNISRRGLQHVIKAPYFVTEKSDGSRKLLYVVKDPVSSAPIACVMDRARTVERLEGSERIGATLREGTILDGELVFNLSHGRHIFLVFDILCHGEKKLWEKPFTERLKILRSEIIPEVNKIPFDSCTPIIMKTFHDKRKIADLTGRIKLVNGKDRIFFDPTSNGYRHHRTDGIIFQPDTPYCFGSDIYLIKWKYSDLMSVDLQVTEDSRQEIRLASIGPEDMLIDCTQRAPGIPAFGTFSNYRLKADFFYLREQRKGARKTDALIAEVAYNPSIGCWTYFHFREDKTEPNHINTVISVFMEQAENIELEELEYRLLARDETENDFGEQMMKMRAKAIDFQRKRTASSGVKK